MQFRFDKSDSLYVRFGLWKYGRGLASAVLLFLLAGLLIEIFEVFHSSISRCSSGCQRPGTGHPCCSCEPYFWSQQQWWLLNYAVSRLKHRVVVFWSSWIRNKIEALLVVLLCNILRESLLKNLSSIYLFSTSFPPTLKLLILYVI